MFEEELRDVEFAVAGKSLPDDVGAVGRKNCWNAVELLKRKDVLFEELHDDFF